jgi:hypothetical protein
MFKTIVTEMRGQSSAFNSQTSRSLFQDCMTFCQQLHQQYMPLTRTRLGQQANEVISLAQTLYKKFECLISGNLTELQQIMSMEGQGTVGGVGNGKKF